MINKERLAALGNQVRGRVDHFVEAAKRAPGRLLLWFMQQLKQKVVEVTLAIFTGMGVVGGLALHRHVPRRPVPFWWLLIVLVPLGVMLYGAIRGKWAAQRYRWRFVLGCSAVTTWLGAVTLALVGSRWYWQVAGTVTAMDQPGDGAVRGGQLLTAAVGAVLLGGAFLIRSLWDTPLFGRVSPPRVPKQHTGEELVLGWTTEREPVILPAADRRGHITILGATGSGKTRHLLTPMVLQDLARPGIAVTVLEPKGDWVAKLMPIAVRWRGRDNVYWIRAGRKRSDYINLVQIGDPFQAGQLLAATLEDLFGTAQSESFWRLVASVSLMMLVRLVRAKHGKQASLHHVAEIIMDEAKITKIAQDITTYLGSTRARQELSALDRSLAQGLTGWVSQEFGQQREKMNTFLAGLRLQMHRLTNDPAVQVCLIPHEHGRAIDPDQHLREGSVIFVDTNDGRLGAEMSAVVGKLITNTIGYAEARREGEALKRKLHAFYIDEAGAVLSPRLVNAMTKARGFDCSYVLAYQSLGYARELLGEGFVATTISSTRSKIVLGGLEATDAEFWVKTFGSKAGWEQASRTHSQSQRPLTGDYSASLLLPLPTTYTQHTTADQERLVERPWVSFDDLVFLPQGWAYMALQVNGSAKRATKVRIGHVEPDEEASLERLAANGKPSGETTLPDDIDDFIAVVDYDLTGDMTPDRLPLQVPPFVPKKEMTKGEAS